MQSTITEKACSNEKQSNHYNFQTAGLIDVLRLQFELPGGDKNELMFVVNSKTVFLLQSCRQDMLPCAGFSFKMNFK